MIETKELEGMVCVNPERGPLAAAPGSVILPGRITDKWIRNRTDAELCQLCREFDYGTVNGKRFFNEIARRSKDLIRRHERYLQNAEVS